MLGIKFILEFFYCLNGYCDVVGKESDFPAMTLSLEISITIVVLSDILPILALIVCMWLSGKAQVDYLVSGYLKKPTEGDRTTFVGSHMLDDLKAELAD